MYWLRFKREMFVANIGSVYGLRYSKKSNLVVYWVRILMVLGTINELI